MYGPPGNGKTISMKAIMKSAPATPLYVRNFNHYGGPEMAMKVVFAKARQLAPSLLILEDLDALITSGTKSYFLNEVGDIFCDELELVAQLRRSTAWTITTAS